MQGLSLPEPADEAWHRMRETCYRQALRPPSPAPPSPSATHHTSMAVVYPEHDSSSSGARYQRVTTYSVMNSFSLLVLRKAET